VSCILDMQQSVPFVDTSLQEVPWFYNEYQTMEYMNGSVINTRKVFVGGLSATTNEADLFHFFKEFGFINFVNVIRNNVTGASRGFGFCHFYNDNAMFLIQEAQAKGPLYIKGRHVSIRPYVLKEARMSFFDTPYAPSLMHWNYHYPMLHLNPDTPASSFISTDS
jgi:RNA recognition motif-containing protein